jgi:hypothetical protein
MSARSLWRGLLSAVLGAGTWLLVWLVMTSVSGIALYGEPVTHSPAWVEFSALLVASAGGVYAAIRSDPARRPWCAAPTLLLTLVYAGYHSEDSTRVLMALLVAGIGMLLARLLVHAGYTGRIRDNAH